MKIVIAIISLLLVAAIAIAGVYLYMQSQAPAAPSSSQTLGEGEKPIPKGPSSIYKIPEALERSIKANPDTVGWITVPNTDINNAVMQSPSDTYETQFYLRRNEKKEDDIYGCYFADFESPVGEREVLEPNTVIYGHSSPGDDPDGKRFSQLFRFANADFAKTTPYVYIATPQERLVFEIFAVFYTKTDFQYNLVQITNEEMRGITQKAEELSLYDYAGEVTAEDRILTLSTCSANFSPNGDGRFVIMAKLLPAGAAENTEANFTVK